VVRGALVAAARIKPGSPARTLDSTLARVVASARAKDALAALELAERLDLVAPMRQAALHPESEVRAAAVGLLAERADPPQAIAVLESALGDPDPRMRLAALDAAAQQSGRLAEHAVELLVRGTRAASAAERWAAFGALGSVTGPGIPAAVRVLARTGRHPSEERRLLAMRSLGALAAHSREAVQALVEGTLDSAVDVRTEAQAMLGEHLGRHASLPELKDLLRSSARSALQRHLAISALAWSGRIHGPAAVERALGQSAWPEERPVVIRMAARLAIALARRQERPEEVIGWLFGG